MQEKRSPNFLVGFFIGTLVVLLVWYWQKSTSAEDGALELLDRHAQSQARIRELERQTGERGATVAASDVASPETADDLQEILGIGPTYARRLQEAGIRTYADLARQTPDHVREITGISLRRTAEAAEWIADARRLAG